MLCSLKKSPPTINLKFGQVELSQVDTHKHLGLTFSKTLNWSSHINSLLDSVTPMANILKILKHSVDRHSLEKIYFTFIRPRLEYGCHILDNCSAADASKLEDFQLGIAWTVTGAKRGTSHDALYIELGWLKLSERRNNIKMKIFSNIAEGNAPAFTYAH